MTDNNKTVSNYDSVLLPHTLALARERLVNGLKIRAFVIVPDKMVW